MMKRIFLYLLLLYACAFVACSDDDTFSTSRQNLLTFSVDTVQMDTVFSTIGSSTYTFWVFNHSNDGIRLKSVRLRQGNQTGFRVNVDGSYLDNSLGSVVNDLEVRKGDSIRVFVELTAPETQKNEPQVVEDDLVFALESGVEQRVCLRSWAWDALRLQNLVVKNDTLIESSRPIIVYGGIKVDSLATLTIRNTMLYFHAGKGIEVFGTLMTDSATLRGDRLDHMFANLPYDRVSGQWGDEGAIIFHSSSTGNVLKNTEIRNAGLFGIRCDSAAYDSTSYRVDLQQCVIHNTAGTGIAAYNSNIRLYDCQITNAWHDCLAVYGGKADIKHCTIAQFYPFSAPRGAAVYFTNYVGDYDYPLYGLLCDSSIMTGYEDEVWTGALRDTAVAFEYYFMNTLIRAAEDSDSTRFRNIIWESAKDTVLQGIEHFPGIDVDNYYYDFHLDSLSRAWGLGCYR